ncbi:phospholipid-transporting ATPase 1 [Amborella trichopoda]|uniref:phospholipid-transporting ATPase 1 n=1 Tax=Amborella trichopoda TaxID=13333 RepID=UPI0005D3663A|nr:phospholipid-transporting ATPase 1 [Amborella trichopoda]XP_020521697.1 phospholipid-transporting ATPase 1 [Amborella trichopoda]|eukprot:XP_011622669.1 phospholipid-transporting ATPase 1 [Amborella trichopoda]
MTSGQPLLFSQNASDSLSLDAPPPLKRGSFSCLCRTGSVSSSHVSSTFSDLDDAQSHFVDAKNESLSRRKLSWDVASIGERDLGRNLYESECTFPTTRFQSAESQFFQHVLSECHSQPAQSVSAFSGHHMEHDKSSDLLSRSALEISSGPSMYIPTDTASSSRREKLNHQRTRRKSWANEDILSSEENARFIHINDPRRTNDKYEFTGNEIRTSKYTVITFLPKNLFIQFHRVAYIYFLVIAALNQLPPLAVFGRTVSLFPLLFVLFVTAIKDGYEDWRRHRSDRKENNREAKVLQGARFYSKEWKKIRVGEILKIHADETIPCDMVLLRSSDPSGIAYVQTMNLDGESNLKTRYARQETASTDYESEHVTGLIRCEQPNRNIYEFTANMEFGGQRIPLGQSNIVLRGCQLKNTDWIIGVVVYAGQETKAMLNSAISPSKRSKLEGYMNRETLWLSVFLFVMCAVVAFGMGLWLERHMDRLDTLPFYRRKYFTKGQENGKRYNYYGLPLEIFFSFLSSVIVFQIMIPISLYISMELVRLGQSYFMIGDTRMYDCSSDSRFQCRSLNINEDLGQIRYVFCDKTGTLTENKMEFRKASIHGQNYGNSSYLADQQMQDTSEGRPGKGGIADTISRQRWKPKTVVKVDPELVALLHKELVGEERIAAHEFFLTLAACNTVIPIKTGKRLSTDLSFGEFYEEPVVIDYQGESPDEQALVCAASAYGYTLMERTSGHIVIDIHGEEQRLDVLGLHEFDSVRKRMSVVVRFPDDSVKVLVKGADSSIFNILAEVTDQREDQSTGIRCATQNHLNEYSLQGLRTLVLASRDLSEMELEEWFQSYQEASTSLTERSAKLRQTASLIECNLNLLGATGIEDRLQDGVPEAIESLRQAGIKVWVLTGDKQETAISIGLSCKLLTHHMQQIIINGSSEEECKNLLADAKANYGIKPQGCRSKNSKWKKNIDSDQTEVENPNDYVTPGSTFPKTGLHLRYSFDTEDLPEQYGAKVASTMNQQLALIIDGNSLVYILEKDLQPELFDLAVSCRVVLCCRVAPLQKAGVVDLIKSRTNDMTLAIGDGANDVSMIQMADVGVGICGQEGRQAVMASDFAMGQFRFLKRLLLVHGHWNYQRVGYLVLYNFYRNAVFVMMLFWYILCTAFSTTSALTDWSSVFYSVIYTSVPTIVVGILDKDLSHRTLLRYPKLYGAGHRQESYNMRLFWLTMIDTLWQSLVLFYVPLFAYRNSTIDIWSMGSLWTIAVVVLVNVHLAMDIQRWILITHIALWGSIVITYICLVVLDSIPDFPNYWTIYHLALFPTYWLNILLITVLALLPRFLLKVLQQMFWPSDIQIARENEILKRRHLGVKSDEATSSRQWGAQW